MKKLFLLIPALLIMFAAQAKKPGESTTGIQFKESSWADALKQAAKEKKLVFVDFYTTWCGPCKMLKRSTFPDKDLGTYFNANFVNLTIDAEKGEGVELAQKYQVRGYPALFVIDKEGNVVHQTLGYIPADQLLQFGKDAREKAAPAKKKKK